MATSMTEQVLVVKMAITSKTFFDEITHQATTI
jgi:hypothetical protein